MFEPLLKILVRIGIASVVAAALPAQLFLSRGAAADFTPPKTLTIALDDNYAPYSFEPENGPVQGIMRDLWELDTGARSCAPKETIS